MSNVYHMEIFLYFRDYQADTGPQHISYGAQHIFNLSN